MENLSDKKTMVEQYLELTGTRKLFETQMNEILFKLACQATTQEETEKLKLFKTIWVWDNVKPVVIKSLIDVFPTNILSEMIRFYDSETGEFLRENGADMMLKMQTAVEEFLEKTLSDLD